jgi:hypothetical protein
MTKLKEMPRTGIKWSLFVVLLFAQQMLLAQHDHGSHDNNSGTEEHHTAPHNGHLKKSGKYEVEMVHNAFAVSDALSFYIYKSNHKAVLNQGITGTITYTKKDGTTSTENLKAKGQTKFVAQMTGDPVTSCSVEFSIGKKKYSVVFTF